MRKKILMAIILLISISFIACDESTNPIEEKGTINITSTPTGAQIWLDGDNTGQVTPATIEATAGFHDITLKLAGYSDIILSHLSVTAGKETLITEGTTFKTLGSLTIESEPAGAEIWLNGSNSGQVTPATIGSLQSGSYEITLKLGDLGDSTLAAVTVNDGATTNVTAKLDFGFEVYSTPVKMWETQGTTADQPSGLDLSTGEAVSSTNSQKVDIYYSSTGFVVRSATDRKTWFKIGDGNNLNDDINSSVKTSSWLTKIGDRESNYVFLYDADGHYSKLKIVNHGGGNPGDPAWVEGQWIYNKVQDDVSF
jgi:hypothetical protein